MFPTERVEVKELTEILIRAYKASDDNFGEQEALRWAGGFRFPQDIATRDSNRLVAANFNLEKMAQRQHTVMATNRLSIERVNKWVDIADPDLQRLISLVEGIPILTGKDFIPNENPPPLRKKYLRVSPAVNKLMYQLYEKDLIFILPTKTVKTLPNIHFSSTHWTTKKGKECGRPIGDASSSEQSSALNSDEVKALADEAFGKIEHPTIGEELTGMINKMAKKHGWDNIILWKMDLKGAFTLLFVKPGDVGLLAFELTDDITMMYHTGMFGWTGMPSGFQIITRVLKRGIRRRIHGECDMYVDDLLGVCHCNDVQHDMGIARDVCNGLLGPGAVEEKKTHSGRVMDWVGWEMNLDTRMVSLASHNFLNTLYGFISVDVTTTIVYSKLQSLASWASRYALICRYMRPFTGDLHSQLKGRHSGKSITLSKQARRCILMWQCMLCLLELRNGRYGRCIETFGVTVPKYAVEFDASLTGVGLLIFHLDKNGTETFWKVAKFEFNFDLRGDSSFQNTVEFIGVVLAMSCLVGLGIGGTTIHLRGII